MWFSICFPRSLRIILSVAQIESNFFYRTETKRNFSGFLSKSWEMLSSLQLKTLILMQFCEQKLFKEKKLSHWIARQKTLLIW